jgi:hypothetical protein
LELGELLFFGWKRRAGGEFFFAIPQPFFPDWKEGIGAFSGFAPAIAGEGLKGRRDAVGAGSAVSVGAVGVHIHVGLDQQRSAQCGGMFQLEDGFGVEEIVTRKELVESGKVGLNVGDFPLVEVLEKGGDVCVAQHGFQAGEDLWKGGVESAQVLEVPVRAGHSNAEL